jgi:predicted nucleotidyltransferase
MAQAPDTIEARELAENLLAAVVDGARHALGQRLTAVYALGSLAHGGFSAHVSDIDVGLVLGDPLDGKEAEAVAGLISSIAASKRPFADRLSVFWGSISTLSSVSSGGRFPPLDRLDLKQFGRVLAGRDVRGELPSPTQKELVLAGAEFALCRLATDEVTAKVKNPKALASSDPRTLTKLVLYPVRFLFTARTGEVGGNEAAVDHFVSHAKGPASTLARMAIEWRHVPPHSGDNDAVEAMASGLMPLYQEFLLDYEHRLRGYGRADLAEAFSQWQQRLRA